MRPRMCFCQYRNSDISIFSKSCQYVRLQFGGDLLFEKIKSLCETHNISVSKLEKLLGFGNATIVRWGKGCIPTVDKLKAVADYFNVSVDFLLEE